ncbi:hypothetical protein [Rhizorhabdus sp. FW153]|uniref:hypothetical protein n=1 Tax=Rhizorhabdus sp. FW153 TaxID=3400216 RepID=UPI003CF78E19
MGNDKISGPLSEAVGNDMRKRWSAPVIEDADISAITHGGGDSGVEGTDFLKAGS